MISYYHHDVVRLSVRLCNAVHCGVEWSRPAGQGVPGDKSCSIVFIAGNFLLTSSDTFAE